MKVATVRIWPSRQPSRIVRVACSDLETPLDAEHTAGAGCWAMWASRCPQFVGWDLAENADRERFFTVSEIFW